MKALMENLIEQIEKPETKETLEQIHSIAWSIQLEAERRLRKLY